LAKDRMFPIPDPVNYGDIDDYTSFEQEQEEIERSLKSFQGLPYTPHTDDSAYYDGESYGYEG